jgi:hypothetical protein
VLGAQQVPIKTPGSAGQHGLESAFNGDADRRPANRPDHTHHEGCILPPPCGMGTAQGTVVAVGSAVGREVGALCSALQPHARLWLTCPV